MAELPVKSRSDEIWAVIPGEELIIAEVTIPTSNRRKLMQAIPYALEEQLAEDIAELYFILLRWKPGHSATVGILAKRVARECRESLVEAGWELAGMVAEYQLLPLHPRTSATIADHGDGRTSIWQRNGTGATIDSDNLGICWNTLHGDGMAVAVNRTDTARRLPELAETDTAVWDIGDDFCSWLQRR